MFQRCEARTEKLTFNNLSGGQIIDVRREFVSGLTRKASAKTRYKLEQRASPDTPYKKMPVRVFFVV